MIESNTSSHNCTIKTDKSELSIVQLETSSEMSNQLDGKTLNSCKKKTKKKKKKSYKQLMSQLTNSVSDDMTKKNDKTVIMANTGGGGFDKMKDRI